MSEEQAWQGHFGNNSQQSNGGHGGFRQQVGGEEAPKGLDNPLLGANYIGKFKSQKPSLGLFVLD